MPKPNLSEEHQRPPLDVPIFWKKPGIQTPTPLEEWKEDFRITMLAKYTIRVGKILNPVPPPVQVPPILEIAPPNETRQAETERVARITATTTAAQTQNDTEYKKWEDRKIGSLSVEDADDKAVSTLYIMLGLEGRRQLVQRFPHVQLSDLKFHELWDYLDQAFLVERNITVDRVKFLSHRQRAPKTLEQFHAALTGLAPKCRLGTLENELIRDVFISNIDHLDLQRRFCIKMLSPEELFKRMNGAWVTKNPCPMPHGKRHSSRRPAYTSRPDARRGGQHTEVSTHLGDSLSIN